MKKIALALFCIAFTAAASAQEEPAQTVETVDERKEVVPLAPRGSTMQDLVDASKAAKASREKNATKKRKVITNADVKKSTGKLAPYVPKELPAGAEVTVVSASTLELHAARLRELKAAEERFAIADKRVAELSKDLNALELSFYEENDPNYRDGVIQQRFAQTRRQLEDARSGLANARDALRALEQPAGPQPEVIEAEPPPQP